MDIKEPSRVLLQGNGTFNLEEEVGRGGSQDGPGPLSKRKRRLDSLEAAQGAPRELRRDSRGERSPWLPLEPHRLFFL